jgi:hypothetical protein
MKFLWDSGRSVMGYGVFEHSKKLAGRRHITTIPHRTTINQDDPQEKQLEVG